MTAEARRRSQVSVGRGLECLGSGDPNSHALLRHIAVQGGGQPLARRRDRIVTSSITLAFISHVFPF